MTVNNAANPPAGMSSATAKTRQSQSGVSSYYSTSTTGWKTLYKTVTQSYFRASLNLIMINGSNYNIEAYDLNRKFSAYCYSWESKSKSGSGSRYTWRGSAVSWTLSNVGAVKKTTGVSTQVTAYIRRGDLTNIKTASGTYNTYQYSTGKSALTVKTLTKTQALTRVSTSAYSGVSSSSYGSSGWK